MSFRGGRRRWRPRTAARSAAGACAIGYPDVAVAIHIDPMRCDQEARTEALDQSSVLIKVENWIEHRILARVRAASFRNPNGLPVLINFNGAGRSPHSAFGQLCPILNSFIRVWQRVRRLRIALPERRLSPE